MIFPTSVVSLIFFVTILANVAIAGFVFASNQKNATYRTFFALSIAVASWLTAMYASQIIVLQDFVLIMAKTTLALATPMNVLFFLFAKTVPDEKYSLSRRATAFLLALASGVVLLSVSPLAFARVDMIDGVTTAVPGPALPVFGLFSVGLNVAAVIELFRKMRRAQDQRRKQMQFVMLGTLAMFLCIVATIFIPVLLYGNSQFVALAPIYVSFFTALTAYAIFKQRLLDIHTVAAEMFCVALLVVNSVQLFLSETPFDFTLRLLTFVAVAIVSVLFLRSISDEVKRREELQILSKKLADANEQLKTMDDLKSEFISIASHQLRTPISVIKGYLSLMLEGAYGKQEQSAKDKIEHMYDMNERLVQMVNNMLNVSRMEKNKLEYLCDSADVAKIAWEAVEEMAFKAKQGAVTLAFARPEAPIPAFVDKEKLHEVFSNLLDNAIKYSPKGGTITVKIVPYKKGEEVLVTVADEGLGMSEEDVKGVFQKFHRIRNEKTIGISGTGLGLYVCMMFVEGMGGKIWIEKSAPNKGTTFAFVLPTQPKQQCIRPAKKIPTPRAV